MVIKVEFEKDLEQKFREAAMRRYGYSKGSITKATEDAVRAWVKGRDMVEKSKDPFKLIEGVLSHLRGKYTSVQLQHETSKLWK